MNLKPTRIKRCIRQLLLLAVVLFVSATTLQAQTFTAGNIVVERIGSGTGTLTGNGTPVFLDQFTTAGSLVSTYPFPAAASRPSSAPFNLMETATGTNTGYLTRSSDKKLLVVPGYNGLTTDASIASSSSSTIGRTIGIVNTSGVVSTPTTVNMFSGQGIRSLASDGVSFWAGGANGLNYVANSSATTATNITSGSIRAVAIFNGQLYYSTASGVFKVGSGLPTTATAGTQIVTTGGGNAFYINAASTVLYIADESTSPNGGIRKYTFNGTVWTFAYALNTTQVRGLCVDFSGADPVTGIGAIAYATTSSGTSNNSLIKVIDTGSSTTATTLASAGTNKIFRGVEFAPVNTSSVDISAAHPAAGNINQASSDNIIGAVSLAVTSSSTTLSSVAFTTSGTYQLSDISNFKFWVNTTNSLAGATQLGSTLSSVASGGTISVSGLGNTLTAGSTYYVIATASVNVGATTGNTIGITSTPFSNIVFAAGTAKTGTDPVAASADQTIIALTPSVDLSSASPASSGIPQNTDNNIIHSISMNVTVASATLTGISVTTAGSYTTADLKTNAFKVWFNSANSLSGATLLGTAQPSVSSGGSITLTGLSVPVAVGVSYVLVTADASYNADITHTISITSTPFSSVVFLNATKTGTDPIAAGNAHTFTAVTPGIALTQTGPAAGLLFLPVNKAVLYQFNAAVTVNATDLNALSFTASGTFQASDLNANSFKLWYNSTNSLATASQIGSSQVVTGSGQTISFTGLNQHINPGATGFFWLTGDVSATAVNNRTIVIDSVPYANIIFSAGTLSGINPLPAGGVQTFRATPQMAEVIFPKYAINGNTTGHRLQYVCRMNITNLAANATYRYFTTGDGAGTEFFINNNFSNAGGYIAGYTSSKSLAGTVADSNEFASTNRYGEFVTDGTGSYTGWFSMVPTGNAVFDAGNQVTFFVQLNDGAGGTTSVTTLASTNKITMINPATGTNGGRAVRGLSSAAAEHIVLLYDDTSGTGRPVYGTWTENDSIATNFSTWYQTNVDGVNGAWGAYIPVALPNGIRRIEQRDIPTGALVGCPAKSNNGVWTNAGNTVNPTGGTTPIVFSNNDAPLTCPILNTITTGVISPATYCVDGFNTTAVSVPFTSTEAYGGGNIYTAQLSDASGSFAAPVAIGTLSSNANSGTIAAAIPAGTAGGTGYRIRVVSSSPAITGTNNGSDITITSGVNFYADFDADNYGDPFNSITACTAFGGYIADNTDCDDFNPAVNPGVTEVCANMIDDNCDAQIDENCNAALLLNIKVFLQGYYQGSGVMSSGLMNQGVSSDPTEADSLVLELRDTIDPNTIVFTSTGVLKTDGTITYQLPSALETNSYYLVVYTRNHLQTWSKTPVLISAVTFFDFTVTAP